MIPARTPQRKSSPPGVNPSPSPIMWQKDCADSSQFEIDRADGIGYYFFFRLYEIYELVVIPQSLR